MRVLMFVAAASALALSACQTKPAETVEPVSQTQPISWVCGDVPITVTYRAATDDAELAFQDGSKTVMKHVPAASGAKFSNDANEFWSKGDEATYTVGKDAVMHCTIAK